MGSGTRSEQRWLAQRRNAAIEIWFRAPRAIQAHPMWSSRWCLLALALALGACEEDETAVADPEPVAPVEVTADPEGDPPSESVEALRARVAELEQQLAQCRGDTPPPSAPQTVAIPEGVDVPAGGAGADEPDPADPSTSSSSPRRREDRDREPLGLPNPLNILMGE